MRQLLRALALIAVLAAPGAASALPPVWVVHDQDSTIVLFGSVHLLPEGLDWRPPKLTAALKGADDVWFEAPMDQAGRNAATAAATAKAHLPPGVSLTAMLSKGGQERLKRYAAVLGLPIEQVDTLNPWYAELLISSSLYEQVGAQGSEGVEQQLWAEAPATAKKRAFETPAEQVGFFADAPMADQVAQLEQTLKDASSAEHDYKALLKAWMNGDLRTLDREVVGPLKKISPRLYSAVVSRRNERWTDAIAGRLQGSGRTVVIVGMGHLIGPDGVPARLRARGIQVDGPR